MTAISIFPLSQPSRISGQRLLEHSDFPNGPLFHNMHLDIEITFPYFSSKIWCSPNIDTMEKSDIGCCVFNTNAFY